VEIAPKVGRGPAVKAALPWLILIKPTNVAPAGMASVNETFVASLGPAFDTVIV